MNQRKTGFTLIEMLVVISIIGVLAAMTVGVSRLASEKMRRSRVTAELQSLVMAIDAYKVKFGIYPPDNKLAATFTGDRSAQHQLYYELAGCVLMQNKEFQEPFFLTSLSSSDLNKAVGVAGIANASTELTEVKNFLPQLKPNHVMATNVAGKPFYMLNVPVKGPAGNSNPWHYNSSSPSNNPGVFDLWADVIIGSKRHIIGNWNQ
jgi:prepilin-type N-terminal cleavage/methylation domain-containing protein